MTSINQNIFHERQKPMETLHCLNCNKIIFVCELNQIIHNSKLLRVNTNQTNNLKPAHHDYLRCIHCNLFLGETIGSKYCILHMNKITRLQTNQMNNTKIDKSNKVCEFPLTNRKNIIATNKRQQII